MPEFSIDGVRMNVQAGSINDYIHAGQIAPIGVEKTPPIISIETSVLPTDLQNELTGCDNLDSCKYVAYDFQTQKVIPKRSTTYGYTTNLTYVVDTGPTSKDDIGLFIKESANTNPTVFTAPPTFDFRYGSYEGTPLGTYVKAEGPQDCSTACENDSQCEGFNYNSVKRTCDTFKHGATHSYSSASISFTKADIKTAPQKVSYDWMQFKTYNDGASCWSMELCNSSINNVLKQNNISDFTTSSIKDCRFCPAYKYHKVSDVPFKAIVTNERGDAIEVTSRTQLMTYMTYTYIPPVLSQYGCIPGTQRQTDIGPCVPIPTPLPINSIWTYGSRYLTCRTNETAEFYRYDALTLQPIYSCYHIAYGNTYYCQDYGPNPGAYFQGSTLYSTTVSECRRLSTKCTGTPPSLGYKWDLITDATQPIQCSISSCNNMKPTLSEFGTAVAYDIPLQGNEIYILDTPTSTYGCATKLCELGNVANADHTTCIPCPPLGNRERYVSATSCAKCSASPGMTWRDYPWREATACWVEPCGGSPPTGDWVYDENSSDLCDLRLCSPDTMPNSTKTDCDKRPGVDSVCEISICDCKTGSTKDASGRRCNACQTPSPGYEYKQYTSLYAPTCELMACPDTVPSNNVYWHGCTTRACLASTQPSTNKLQCEKCSTEPYNSSTTRYGYISNVPGGGIIGVDDDPVIGGNYLYGCALGVCPAPSGSYRWKYGTGCDWTRCPRTPGTSERWASTFGCDIVRYTGTTVCSTFPTAGNAWSDTTTCNITACPLTTNDCTDGWSINDATTCWIPKPASGCPSGSTPLGLYVCTKPRVTRNILGPRDVWGPGCTKTDSGFTNRYSSTSNTYPLICPNWPLPGETMGDGACTIIQCPMTIARGYVWTDYQCGTKKCMYRTFPDASNVNCISCPSGGHGLHEFEATDAMCMWAGCSDTRKITLKSNEYWGRDLYDSSCVIITCPAGSNIVSINNIINPLIKTRACHVCRNTRESSNIWASPGSSCLTMRCRGQTKPNASNTLCVPCLFVTPRAGYTFENVDGCSPVACPSLNFGNVWAQPGVSCSQRTCPVRKQPDLQGIVCVDCENITEPGSRSINGCLISSCPTTPATGNVWDPTDYSGNCKEVTCPGRTEPNATKTSCIDCSKPLKFGFYSPNINGCELLECPTITSTSNIWVNKGTCNTTQCTGHTRPNYNKTMCMNCLELPLYGNTWVAIDGCDYKACPAISSDNIWTERGTCNTTQCTGHTQPDTSKLVCEACPEIPYGSRWTYTNGCQTTLCPMTGGLQLAPNRIWSVRGTCNTTQCTGHTKPNADQTLCEPCQIPYGNTWTSNNGCASTECPAITPGSIWTELGACTTAQCTGRTQPNASKSLCVACPTVNDDMFFESPIYVIDNVAGLYAKPSVQTIRPIIFKAQTNELMYRDKFEGMWYTLTNSANDSYLQNAGHHPVFNASYVYDWTWAWAFYVKDGTTDQIKIFSAFSVDNISYGGSWVRTDKTDGRIKTGSFLESDIYTISIPLIFNGQTNINEVPGYRLVPISAITSGFTLINYSKHSGFLNQEGCSVGECPDVQPGYKWKVIRETVPNSKIWLSNSCATVQCPPLPFGHTWDKTDRLGIECKTTIDASALLDTLTYNLEASEVDRVSSSRTTDAVDTPDSIISSLLDTLPNVNLIESAEVDRVASSRTTDTVDTVADSNMSNLLINTVTLLEASEVDRVSSSRTTDAVDTPDSIISNLLDTLPNVNLIESAEVDRVASSRTTDTVDTVADSTVNTLLNTAPDVNLIETAEVDRVANNRDTDRMKLINSVYISHLINTAYVLEETEVNRISNRRTTDVIDIIHDSTVSSLLDTVPDTLTYADVDRNTPTDAQIWNTIDVKVIGDALVFEPTSATEQDLARNVSVRFNDNRVLKDGGITTNQFTHLKYSNQIYVRVTTPVNILSDTRIYGYWIDSATNKRTNTGFTGSQTLVTLVTVVCPNLPPSGNNYVGGYNFCTVTEACSHPPVSIGQMYDLTPGVPACSLINCTTSIPPGYKLSRAGSCTDTTNCDPVLISEAVWDTSDYSGTCKVKTELYALTLNKQYKILPLSPTATNGKDGGTTLNATVTAFPFYPNYISIPTAGYQYITIPKTDMYTFTVAGGAGSGPLTAGKGAIIKGSIKLNINDTIIIVCGKQGLWNSTYQNIGGGGMSAVFLVSSGVPIPLLVAGGGSGSSYSTAGEDATVISNENTLSSSNGSGAGTQVNSETANGLIDAAGTILLGTGRALTWANGGFGGGGCGPGIGGGGGGWVGGAFNKAGSSLIRSTVTNGYQDGLCSSYGYVIIQRTCAVEAPVGQYLPEGSCTPANCPITPAAGTYFRNIGTCNPVKCTNVQLGQYYMTANSCAVTACTPSPSVGQYYATISSCSLTNCTNVVTGNYYSTAGTCDTTRCANYPPDVNSYYARAGLCVLSPLPSINTKYTIGALGSGRFPSSTFASTTMASPYYPSYIDQPVTGYQRIKMLGPGTYKFTVAGAQGTKWSSTPGGAGAIVEGSIQLSQNDIIIVVVGQTGMLPNTGESPTGGGGMSAVFLISNGLPVPLLVAGGGSGVSANYSAVGASTTFVTETTPSNRVSLSAESGAGTLVTIAGFNLGDNEYAHALYNSTGSNTIYYYNGSGARNNSDQTVGGFGGGGSGRSNSSGLPGGGGGWIGGYGTTPAQNMIRSTLLNSSYKGTNTSGNGYVEITRIS